MKRLLLATIALLAACKPADPPRSPGDSMDYIVSNSETSGSSVSEH